MEETTFNHKQSLYSGFIFKESNVFNEKDNKPS